MAKIRAKTLSVKQILQMFDTPDKAYKWFEEKIWNGSPTCHLCKKKDKIKSVTGHRYYCNYCRRKFSVMSGTIMHSTNLPLSDWAYTFYIILTSRKGISSLQLSKELDITQKTAWYLLQRVREACNKNEGTLGGIVEIDETYIGGKEKNKHLNKRTKGTQGRSTLTKTAVIGARERNGKVKAKAINKTDSHTMRGFVYNNVQTGSTIYTDEHRGYIGLGGIFYKHKSVNHSAKEYVNNMAHTNGIESVWAVLKRGYNGVYHNFSKKHLQRYVDEFSFRLNEGNCQIDVIDRMSSLASNVTGKQITYKALINNA